MNTPPPNQDNREVVIAVYDGQRAESQQHRQTIFNSFSLSLAGLLAIAAGVVAPGHLPVPLKWAIAAVVFIVLVSISIFIHSQRAESEKAMKIMRKIETHLRLFEHGALIPNDVVLPVEFSQPPKPKAGLTKADWFHVLSLVFVSMGIWLLLFLLP